MIRHEAVRKDLEPVAGPASREGIETEGDEAAIPKAREVVTGGKDKMVGVASLVVEGTKPGR